MAERKTYEITVETENPDFLDRLKAAAEKIGLDLDGDSEPHYLAMDVDEWGGEREKRDMVWGTVFDPAEAGEADG